MPSCVIRCYFMPVTGTVPSRRSPRAARYHDPEALRALRAAADMSQEQLGIAAGIPARSARTTMVRYEAGEHGPRLPRLHRIAGALGVDPRVLLRADIRAVLDRADRRTVTMFAGAFGCPPAELPHVRAGHWAGETGGEERAAA